MSDFDAEKWILYCIFTAGRAGCEWLDPTPQQRRIIQSLLARGDIHVFSRYDENTHFNVPLLSFTEKGRVIYIRDDGGFLFEKDFAAVKIGAKGSLGMKINEVGTNNSVSDQQGPTDITNGGN